MPAPAPMIDTSVASDSISMLCGFISISWWPLMAAFLTSRSSLAVSSVLNGLTVPELPQSISNSALASLLTPLLEQLLLPLPPLLPLPLHMQLLSPSPLPLLLHMQLLLPPSPQPSLLHMQLLLPPSPPPSLLHMQLLLPP